jgi:hypothetical protein
MTTKTENQHRNIHRRIIDFQACGHPTVLWLAILSAVLLISCSHMPFFGNDQDKPTGPGAKTAKVSPADPKGVDLGEEVKEDPKPGDIQIMSGIEYIYTKNKKYMLTPYEPEYVWVTKDQHVPDIGEQVKSALSGGDNRGRAELEARLAKLEEEYKKIGMPPQRDNPPRTASLPVSMPISPLTTLSSPVSSMTKRRILVLPVEDRTSYKKEHLGELATRRLISRLENTNAVICVDPGTLAFKGKPTDPLVMKVLNEVHGIQAVLKGTLSNVYTTTSKMDGKDRTEEASFAISNMIVDVYSTETMTLLKQVSGRNSVVLSREEGEMNSEKSRVKSVDLSIETLADDLLRSVLSIEWHARIASLGNGRIYINAGRLSGINAGTTLEVYEAGIEVLDSRTKQPLGKTKGIYKGQVRVAELFGVDASWATPVKGGGFSSSDFVYLK